MWVRRFDDAAARRFDFGGAATIDVLAEGTSAKLAAIRVTVAGRSRVGEHDYGASDALLFPLAGRLKLHGRDGDVDLGPGAIALVAAGERVSIENSTEVRASMLVCFAPPTFVAALLAASAADASAGSHSAVRAACA